MKNNPFFKLILIEEIKRKTLNKNICEFYEELPDDELELQLLCVDATLSRGSLPLSEKIMKKMGFDENYINDKLKELSNYDFYFSDEKIYNYIINNFKKKNNVLFLDELKNQAKNGQLNFLDY